MTDRTVSHTILLTVDALRADHLSQNGYTRNTMPALNRIDSSGTQYESAFANGTNTGVSLPSLLSSQYHGTKSCVQGPTIATVLGKSDIRTAGFHSNTLFADAVGQPAGFIDFTDFDVGKHESSARTESLVQRIYNRSAEKIKPITEQFNIKSTIKRLRDAVLPAEVFHSMSYYVSGEELTDSVIQWLHKHSDEPFFLWVHYLDPHRPYGIDVDNPTYGEPADEKEISNLMSKAGVNPESLTNLERRRLIDLYDSDLRYTSRAIDRLFDELESLNIWDDTAIICTADHGEEFGEHKKFFHRNLPFDELLHVPLFVKAPGYHDSTVTEQRELLDIGPTICELMNVESPSAFRGIPLKDGGRRKVIATGSFAEPEPVVAGRWDGYKYIFSDNREYLYDLDDDPEENINIIDEHSQVSSTYQNSIPPHLFTESRESYEQETNQAVRDRLEGLGYME